MYAWVYGSYCLIQSKMINEYYKLPFQPQRVMNKQEHPKCTLSDSVAGIIHLMVITGFGDCQFDNSFGCEIWEHDFENIFNSQIYREKLRSSIQATIVKHEYRITNVNVGIQIDQIDYKLDNHKVKSRVRLKIDAVLLTTNEPFSYSDQFYIGPLSY